MWVMSVFCPICKSYEVQVRTDVLQYPQRIRYVCLNCGNKFDILDARREEGFPVAIAASCAAYSGSRLIWPPEGEDEKNEED